MVSQVMEGGDEQLRLRKERYGLKGDPANRCMSLNCSEGETAEVTLAAGITCFSDGLRGEQNATLAAYDSAGSIPSSASARKVLPCSHGPKYERPAMNTVLCSWQ